MPRTHLNVGIADLAPLISEIAAKLGESRDPADLYDTVVQICMKHFGAEASSLYLPEADGNAINMVAGQGYSASIVGQARYERLEGVTGHVWALGQPFKADSNDELLRSDWHLGKMNDKQWAPSKYAWSLLVVPLKIGDRVLGVLKVENKKPEPAAFSEDESQLLQAIANVVALVVVEHARSHALVLSALQRAVADLSEAGSYFPAALYGRIVTTCMDILGASAASLYLESDDGTLAMVAGDGYSRSLVDTASYGPCEGITGHVWSEGASVKIDTVEDLEQHPWWAGKHDACQWSAPHHAWSLIAVPLRIGGRVIGVLKAENKLPEPAAFTAEEQRTLNMIASIAALSVHNERSVRRLQEAGLFAYDYAHDSKGDLAVLQNALRSLRAMLPAGMSTTSEQYLSLMDSQIHKLSTRAVEILGLAKDTRTVPAVIALQELREPLRTRWAWHLEQNAIELVDGTALPGVSIIADREMLWSVLDNLVQNSLEQIASRRATAPHHRGTIGFFASADESRAQVYVCDDATGIPPEAQAKLFQDQFTTKPRGTGLGLRIVKRYMELMGGTVTYLDAVPSGVSPRTDGAEWKAVFRLDFPRGQSARLSSVLVVDDNRGFYELMRLEFGRHPLFGEVDWAHDLRQALQALAAKRYDAVVLDMHFPSPLPQGDAGYERLRAQGFTGLIIMVSVHQEKLEIARKLRDVAVVIDKSDAHLIADRCAALLEQREAQPTADGREGQP